MADCRKWGAHVHVSILFLLTCHASIVLFQLVMFAVFNGFLFSLSLSINIKSAVFNNNNECSLCNPIIYLFLKDLVVIKSYDLISVLFDRTLTLHFLQWTVRHTVRPHKAFFFLSILQKYINYQLSSRVLFWQCAKFVCTFMQWESSSHVSKASADFDSVSGWLRRLSVLSLASQGPISRYRTPAGQALLSCHFIAAPAPSPSLLLLCGNSEKAFLSSSVSLF